MTIAEADSLLRGGDVAGARAALVEIVRKQPSDEQARMFLFQLLAIAGEWDKARAQLQALAQLSAEAQMLSVAYGQAIEAERVRAAVFTGAQKVSLLVHGDGWAAPLADAIALLATGQHEAGIAARDAALDAAPDCPGQFNATRFDWVADADSRFGPAMEAIICGQYGLVPFDAIAAIKSDGPVDLRDILWYPVEIAFRTGQSVAGFLPARYPGTEAADDDGLRLGRGTDWVDTGWGETGVGQRLWVTSDGEDHGLLSLRSLVFD